MDLVRFYKLYGFDFRDCCSDCDLAIERFENMPPIGPEWILLRKGERTRLKDQQVRSDLRWVDLSGNWLITKRDMLVRRKRSCDCEDPTVCVKCPLVW